MMIDKQIGLIAFQKHAGWYANALRNTMITFQEFVENKFNDNLSCHI